MVCDAMIVYLLPMLVGILFLLSTMTKLLSFSNDNMVEDLHSTCNPFVTYMFVGLWGILKPHSFATSLIIWNHSYWISSTLLNFHRMRTV